MASGGYVLPPGVVARLPEGVDAGGLSGKPWLLDPGGMRLDMGRLGLRQLGQGSSGIVFAGSYDGAPVAIKQAYSMPAAANVAAWVREVATLHGLRVPGVLPVLGGVIALDDDERVVQYFLVMERAAGSLASLVLEVGGPGRPGAVLAGTSMGARLGWLVQVGSALTALHAQALIHGDVKPDNVLLYQEGGAMVARVADFGSSTTRHTSSVTVTMHRQLRGTPLYMDPVLLDSTGSLRPASDVYSYAVLAWHLLTGRWPFPEVMAAGTPDEAVASLRALVCGPAGRRPPLEALATTGVPRAVADVIAACWAPAQADRPTMADATRRMAAVASGDLAGTGAAAAAAAAAVAVVRTESTAVGETVPTAAAAAAAAAVPAITLSLGTYPAAPAAAAAATAPGEDGVDVEGEAACEDDDSGSERGGGDAGHEAPVAPPPSAAALAALAMTVAPHAASLRAAVRSGDAGAATRSCEAVAKFAATAPTACMALRGGGGDGMCHTMVAALVKFGTKNPPAAMAACKAVTAMCVDADLRLQLQAAGAGSQLAGMIRTYAAKANTMMAASLAIKKLANTLANRVPLCRDGVVPALLAAINAHPRNPAALYVPLTALGAICHNTPDAATAVYAAGAVPVMLRAMRGNPGKPRVLNPGCTALARLATVPALQALLCRDGVGKAVMAALRTTDHITVVRSGVSVFVGLAEHPPNRAPLLADGVAEVVVTSLRRHADDAAVVKQAATAASYLADNAPGSGGASGVLCRAGTPAALTAALRSGAAGCIAPAVAALRRVADTAGPSERSLLLVAGTVAVVRDIQAAFADGGNAALLADCAALLRILAPPVTVAAGAAAAPAI